MAAGQSSVLTRTCSDRSELTSAVHLSVSRLLAAWPSRRAECSPSPTRHCDNGFVACWMRGRGPPRLQMLFACGSCGHVRVQAARAEASLSVLQPQTITLSRLISRLETDVGAAQRRRKRLLRDQTRLDRATKQRSA